MAPDRKYRRRGKCRGQTASQEMAKPKEAEPSAARRFARTCRVQADLRVHALWQRRFVRISMDSRCSRYGVDLRSCVKCRSLEPGARFGTASRSPRVCRGRGNTCEPSRLSVERETGSPAPPARGESVFVCSSRAPVRPSRYRTTATAPRSVVRRTQCAPTGQPQHVLQSGAAPDVTPPGLFGGGAV